MEIMRQMLPHTNMVSLCSVRAASSSTGSSRGHYTKRAARSHLHHHRGVPGFGMHIANDASCVCILVSCIIGHMDENFEPRQTPLPCIQCLPMGLSHSWC